MYNKAYILILICFLVFNCSSSKKNKNFDKSIYGGEIDGQVIKTILTKDTLKDRLYTTDFYNIMISADLRTKTFEIGKKKEISIKISNLGTKDLYLPKWFNQGKNNHAELYIELFKKTKKQFEPYRQKNLLVKTNSHSKNTENREIVFSKNGNTICYDNIVIDKYLKIVDEGIYYAKIYIDLSNFGYFKKLTCETSQFEVK